MTLTQVYALNKHWSQHPPTNVTLEAIGMALGAKWSAPKLRRAVAGDKLTPPNVLSETDMQQLTAVFGLPVR